MDEALLAVCQLSSNSSWVDFVWLLNYNVPNPCAQAGLIWLFCFISFAITVWQMIGMSMFNRTDDLVELRGKFRCVMVGSDIVSGLMLVGVGVAYCSALYFIRQMKFLTMFESGVTSVASLLRTVHLLKCLSRRVHPNKTVCSSQIGIWLPITMLLCLRTFASLNYWRQGWTDWSALDFAMDLTTALLTLILLIVSLSLLLESMWTVPLPSAEDETLLVDRTDQVLLGTGDEKANFVSRLVFYWVNQLMLKGYRGQLTDVDEVFQLPADLNSHQIEQKFNDVKSRKGNSLIRVLLHSFGAEYFLLGILKFLGDGLSFSGPILLNLLIGFMEGKEDNTNGYYYALGIFVCTLFTSIFQTHFGYQINRVGLKIRVAMVAAVYRKILNVSVAQLSKFSTGEITNFFSTDSDRIVGFCPSFHDLWSLPMQVAIAFYLLHREVGLAFLAGVAFAIILIPINRCIAVKIGQLTTEMMAHKDGRVKTMTELLFGIRVIKYSGWERHFEEKVESYRAKELRCLRSRKYLDALCVFLWASSSILVSLLTFTTYVLLGNRLTAAKVFTSISLFNMLMFPLNAFPWVINGMVEAWVSSKRLQRFFNLEELDLSQYYHTGSDGSVIVVDSGKFTWSEAQDDPRIHLDNLHLSIKKGQFVGLTGAVGSGKSSLFAALLGEMNRIVGVVHINDKDTPVSFVAQDPWLLHGTVRSNILFGQPYRDDFYRSVVEACALSNDFQAMPMGDLTLVGEQGVTLSGGQKARLALARAVYQDTELYMLDSPDASVDAHVGQHIYEQCIRGLLKNKTVLLATHHKSFLKDCDAVVFCNQGMVTTGSAVVMDEVDKMQKASAAEEKQEASESDSNVEVIETGPTEPVFMSEEEKEVGNVKFDVYISYMKAIGFTLTFLIFLSLLLMQASKNVSDWWLTYWVSRDIESNVSASHTLRVSQHLRIMSGIVYPYHVFTATRLLDSIPSLELNSNSTGRGFGFYLTVYGSLAAGNSFFTLCRSFIFAYGGVVAAKTVQRRLLKKILRAPMRFFDVTPVGRIMNRFSSDLYCVDDSLPFQTNRLVMYIFSGIGTLIMTIYGIPWFALFILPMAIIYYQLQKYYRFTTVALKRISSVSLSPVYSHFSDTLVGVMTIRAFRAVRRFTEENHENLIANQRAQFSSLACSQWLATRLQLMGVAMVTVVAVIAVLEHQFHAVDPGLVGLAITYALSVTSLLNGGVSSFAETEREMVSVERIQQYTNIDEEKYDGNVDPPISWPSTGSVEFRNVLLRYASDLPLALNNVSFTIAPGQKIGVVGRTGSGKSSLLQGLFRSVELESGCIMVDTVDIKQLPLFSLRSNIVIIPQNPFLFSGSFRDNIDIKGECGDQQLTWAVRACSLEETVSKLGGIDASVGERGQRLSAGQRQLLCLARALLKRAKVICLDEASAQLDVNTDKLIQETLQKSFPQSTVITIAHRIGTVMSSDLIFVMDKGRLVEVGSPTELLQRPTSAFAQLYASSN